MSFVKASLQKALSTADSDAEIRAVLKKTLDALEPEPANLSSLNLIECAEKVLEREKAPTLFKLSSPAFSALSSWFALSAGLHVIAAPSSHGKTLYAMEWAKEVSKEEKVIFLSLEMTQEDLGERIISDLTGLSLQKIARNELSDAQKELVKSLLKQWSHLERIIVDNFDSLQWDKIEPRLWQHMTSFRPRLVIVDFVQMIRDPQSDDKRTSVQLANIARALKLFADQNKVAVLLLSQVNREAVREIEKMNIHDVVPLYSSAVKESGGIVEAADSVQLICIPGKFLKCPPHLKGRFQIIVDKNRKMGETGVVQICFNLNNGKFLEENSKT